MDDAEIRRSMVAACRELDANGLNRGASGNVSVRSAAGYLVTPSAVPPRDLASAMMVFMTPSGEGAEAASGKPSSEWRFHRDIYAARPDIGAVVHTHAPFCTILADLRCPIPAIHYMIAAFGGTDIRVADYATFGTEALSRAILTAMEGRNGCLMANHGMVVGGPDLGRAVWLAGELEALAHQYYHCRTLGGGHILSDDEVAETAARFATYGVSAKPQRD